jgi:uncharacterized membrane protein YoaK (UPF0700 family)
MILLLAVAGGSVDAVVILGFGVLTAAQTGNTILLAVNLAQGRLANGLSSAVSVVGYVIGVAVGERVIVGRRDSASGPSAVGWTLVAELVPLGCLLGYWHLAGPNPAQGTIAVLVALAAIAMGIQSAAVLRLHAGPTTTYVTGTLTTFTTEMIRRLHLMEWASNSAPTRQELNSGSLMSKDSPWIYGITWFVYAVGALVSGLLFGWVGEVALVLPIAAIIGVIVAGTCRP